MILFGVLTVVAISGIVVLVFINPTDSLVNEIFKAYMSVLRALRSHMVYIESMTMFYILCVLLYNTNFYTWNELIFLL